MSEENVEVVRTMLDHFNSGDYDRALATLHPEVVWEDPGLIPGRDTHRGRDGVTAWFSHWFEAWENFSAEPLELIDGGDQVVVIERMCGRGRHSGLVVDSQVVAGYVVRDGLVARRFAYDSKADALKAAGRPE